MDRRIGAQYYTIREQAATLENFEEACRKVAEIGEGNLDWDDIIQACEDAGAKWALVEQDICRRDPFESLKMSYDYLMTKGFY